jgi:hypothetical protein
VLAGSWMEQKLSFENQKRDDLVPGEMLGIIRSIQLTGANFGALLLVACYFIPWTRANFS